MELNKNQKLGLIVGIIIALIVSWGIFSSGLSAPALIESMGLPIFSLLVVCVFFGNFFFWYLIISSLQRYVKV